MCRHFEHSPPSTTTSSPPKRGIRPFPGKAPSSYSRDPVKESRGSYAGGARGVVVKVKKEEREEDSASVESARPDGEGKFLSL